MTQTPIRVEKDSFGEINVPATALWGAQTQRSLQYFAISDERMPQDLILALAQVKRACVLVNRELGLIGKDQAAAIVLACDEVLALQHPDAFPLSVWQTGSGTQTNMNMNEVLANRGSELMGGVRGLHRMLHPNDDVNLGQSSNDVFPTAMHVAIALFTEQKLLPALKDLKATLERKSQQFNTIIKIGRTHLQDATPMTLGQEMSGYAAQLMQAEKAIQTNMQAVFELAIGGTAVGTGMNTHAQFGEKVAQILAQQSGLPFVSAPNKFAALAAHDALLMSHGALKMLAAALIKIANDIRWLASGPRAGLGEISLPENEPGSSIMPGKVNPTQAEAMIMAGFQVLANDVAISLGGASGSFELNVAKPLIAHAYLQSLRLLTDSIRSFDLHCASGMVVNEERIRQQLAQSLMLVTALVPHIGYDKSAAIARHAHQHSSTLKEAALTLGHVNAEDFDKWMQAVTMTHPGK